MQKNGFCKPMEFMHLICLFIWNHFNSIQHDGEARKLLFESSLPRNVFVETSTLLLMETMDMPEKLPECKHSLKNVLYATTFKLFNFFVKNMCSEENSVIHLNEGEKAKELIN
jgi:hypothetical protein